MGNSKSLLTKNYCNQMLEQSAMFSYNISLYDHLPYKRDSDLCNMNYMRDLGPSVIHCYRFDTAPYLVPLPDASQAHSQNT